MSVKDVGNLWQILSPYFLDPANGRDRARLLLMGVPHALGDVTCIALVNIGTFASTSVYSAFSVIAKAIKDVPMFPWGEIIGGFNQQPRKVAICINGDLEFVDAPGEGEEISLRQGNVSGVDLSIGADCMGLKAQGAIFKAQFDFIVAHPYGCYRTEAGQGKAVNDLVYLAKELLRRSNGDESVRDYARGQGGSKMTRAINLWISSYISASRTLDEGKIV